MHTIRLSLVLLCVLGISSCIISNGRRGNGKITKQDRTVSEFNSIMVNGVFNVFLKQSDVNSVSVEADENLQDLIEVNANGGVLTLDLKTHENISKSSKMNIYVSFKNLKDLNIDGVGDLDCENRLNVDQLVVVTSGVGKTHLNLNCRTLALKSNGVGDVRLVGSAEVATIHNEGVGAIKAAEFIVQDLNVTNTGVGNCDVDAEKQITIENSGVGNVKHSGNAIVSMQKNDGVGSVEKH